jgi:hypothetical protein
MRLRWVLIFFSLASLFASQHVNAQLIHESEIIALGASGGSPGGVLAFDGSMLFVESGQNQYNDNDVRVFNLNSQRQFVEAPFIRGNNSFNDSFGASMTLNGNYAYIGSPGYGYPSLGPYSLGSVSLYERTGDQWNFITRIVGNQIAGELGASVDFDGHSLIVGAPGETNQYAFPGNLVLGTAYVYTTDFGQYTLLQPTGPKHWSFGRSIAISGDTAVVGAPGDGHELPRAWVFQRDSAGRWNQSAILNGDVDYGGFGTAVDVRGDEIVVGDPKEDVQGNHASGAGYVFRRQSDGSWSRETKLTLNSTASFENFGTSLSIATDNSILIGIPGYERDAADGGAAALFTLGNQNAWIQRLMLLPTVGIPDADFGYKVTMDNNVAIVSSHAQISYRDPAGAEYVFVVPEPASFGLLVLGLSVWLAACPVRRAAASCTFRRDSWRIVPVAQRT